MNLQPGDIFAVRGRGPLGWMIRNLIAPKTDRFHFGIIWKRLADGDYLILESINKGLSIGKLSWYDTDKLEFYRVDCPASLRRDAPKGLIDWGRSSYDYLLVVKLLFGSVIAFFKILVKEKKIRRLRAEDFPYGQNSSLICTEAVDIAYDSVGVNLIPVGVIPLPNAYKAAEIEGRMTRIQS